MSDSDDDIVVVGRKVNDADGGGGFGGFGFGGFGGFGYGGFGGAGGGGGGVTTDPPPPPPIDQLATTKEMIAAAVPTTPEDVGALLEILAINPNIVIGNVMITQNTMTGEFSYHFTVTAPGQQGGLIVAYSNAMGGNSSVGHYSTDADYAAAALGLSGQGAGMVISSIGDGADGFAFDLPPAPDIATEAVPGVTPPDPGANDDLGLTPAPLPDGVEPEYGGGGWHGGYAPYLLDAM